LTELSNNDLLEKVRDFNDLPRSIKRVLKKATEAGFVNQEQRDKLLKFLGKEGK